MNKWIKNEGVSPDVGNNEYDVRLRRGEVICSEWECKYGEFDWSLDGNLRDILEWRFRATSVPVLFKPKEIKPMKENLNQSEVQQLLHIIRGSLYSTTIDKNYVKRLASNLWVVCDKGDASTIENFEDFSNFNSNYKQYKQEEKKLVSLITKLKGLR